MGRMAITETDDILSRGVCRETANRRKQLFAKFYRQEDSTLFTPFLNMDVPQLMFRYLDLWKEVKLTEWGKANKWVKIIRRSFEPEDLLRTEADFRMMLMCSNAIGKMQVKNNVLLPGCRDASVQVGTVRSMSPTRTPTRAASRPDTSSKGSTTPSILDMPDELRLASLRCTNDGMLDLKKLRRLATFEFMFSPHSVGRATVVVIRREMVSKGIEFLSDFYPEQLDRDYLSENSYHSARRNFKKARAE